MRLDQVIPDAPEGARRVEVTDLAYDARVVTPGTLFFCVPGFTRDGHEFAADAIGRGAAALVVEFERWPLAQFLNHSFVKKSFNHAIESARTHVHSPVRIHADFLKNRVTVFVAARQGNKNLKHRQRQLLLNLWV